MIAFASLVAAAAPALPKESQYVPDGAGQVALCLGLSLLVLYVLVDRLLDRYEKRRRSGRQTRETTPER